MVGAPDERWGQRVAAIVEPRKGHSAPSLEAIQELCRTHVAGYKIPRELHVVDKVERAPSGKPDYRWASDVIDRSRSGGRAVEQSDHSRTHSRIHSRTDSSRHRRLPTDLCRMVAARHTAVVTMEVQRGVVGDLSTIPELAREADSSGLVPAVVAPARRCAAGGGGRRPLHGGVQARWREHASERPDHHGAHAQARSPHRGHARRRARRGARARARATT